MCLGGGGSEHVSVGVFGGEGGSEHAVTFEKRGLICGVEVKIFIQHLLPLQ